jgi:hypothetical protein
MGNAAASQFRWAAAAALRMTERRPILPRPLYLAKATFPFAPLDRREISTELFTYCRHTQSAESVTRYHSRRHVHVPPAMLDGLRDPPV